MDVAEKPVWVLGDEKRFAQFVARLGKAKKIALVSHTDLDGIASARVVDEVVHADVLRFVDYDQLTQTLVSELQKQHIDRVIITDLMIDDPAFVQELERFADVLIIDHHLPEQNLNSRVSVHLNAQRFCASYLCYFLFSRIQSVERWDWLVACASLADWAYRYNTVWMRQVFSRYGEAFDASPEQLRKGTFWDVQHTLSLALVYFHTEPMKVYQMLESGFGQFDLIRTAARRVQLEVESCVQAFEREKETLRDGFFWELHSYFPVKSLVSNALSMHYPQRTIILGRQAGATYYLSARRQDRTVEVCALLKKLTAGLSGVSVGGHRAAAGGHFSARDAEEFKKRVLAL